MAQNPDPNVTLTSLAGAERSLDDWTTTFNLAIVLLPARSEASAWVSVIDRMYATLGQSDARTAIWIPSTPSIARRILGRAADEHLVLCDPDAALAASLGLERLPAFVHLRQDTTVVSAAEGWDPAAWQAVADGIARHVHWSSPRVDGPNAPAPSPGWEFSA